MASKTLITGGAGFIGSHLARHLHQLGRDLVLIDDLSTGRRDNVEPLLGKRCELVHDACDEALKSGALLRNVREIYHLAAAVGVKLVVDDPAGMIRTNIDQTHAVLQAAAACRAAVLIASSSEVYGKCPTLPLREDMELVYGPTTASRWSYGLTKALDEHLAIDFARRLGLHVVIARLFNTIGPRQVGRYGMVVPRFVARAVANEPIEVYGNGRQSRTFCDVRDVATALRALLDRDDQEGQIFNVGSQEQTTIDELADHVIRLTGSTAGKRLIPYEAVYGEGFEDPPRRLPDTSRLQAAIGFRRRYGLDDTLREVIALERRRRDCKPPASAVARPR